MAATIAGGASVPAATSQDVAAQVAALGEHYAPYAKKIAAEGVDGTFLQSISPGDLTSLFDDLGVTSTIHKNFTASVTFFRGFQEEVTVPLFLALVPFPAPSPLLPRNLT